MRRSLPILFAVVASITACDRAPDEREEPAPSPATAAQPVDAAPPASGARRYDPTEALLELKGFSLPNPGGRGTPRPFRFGQAESEVIAALTTLRGRAPERSRNDECGAGPINFVSWGDGMELLFQSGQLAGWAVRRGASPGFATSEGVGVGSTLADLRRAYPGATVRDDTIGPEFQAGELFGTLSGATPDARVTAMWAGASCIFR